MFPLMARFFFGGENESCLFFFLTFFPRVEFTAFYFYLYFYSIELLGFRTVESVLTYAQVAWGFLFFFLQF